jgi:Flp pilus assembly pilin Flp
MPRFGSDRRGATAMEYALLVAMIAVASIMAFQLSGGSVRQTMNKASSAMPAPGSGEIPPTP